MRLLQISSKKENGEETSYQIQTPSYMIFSRLAGVPNITQDLLLRTLQLTQTDLMKDALFIHLNYWDLYVLKTVLCIFLMYYKNGSMQYQLTQILY